MRKLWMVGLLALMALLFSACEPGIAPGAAAGSAFAIDPLFREFYLQKGGEQQLGAPTSGVVDENGKQCQYTGIVKMCFDSLATGSDRFYLESLPSQSQIDSPFLKAIDRMGGTRTFGQPLAEAAIAPDGNLEQIFETVIVYSPPDDPGQISFRPVSAMTNQPATLPAPKQFDRRDGVIFYPVQGDLGFHIPIYFDQFIASHGSYEKSGNPISDPFLPDQGNRYKARQCFENYCLDYDNTAPAAISVSLAPLGSKYIAEHPIPERESFIPERVEDETLCVQVSEDKAQLAAIETQTFYLLVYKQRTMEPVPDVTATVTLSLADGRSFSYETPPTGLNGWVSMPVPPIENVNNGTIVKYTICLNAPAADPECIEDSYLIWNYR